MMRYMWSNNVELADGGLLLTTVLVRPLPAGGPGQGSAVLGLASVRLPRTGCVPVFECDGGAGLVHPGALSTHVVDAQPDLLIGADALAEVVSELVVLITGGGRTKDTTQGVTVLAGGVVALPHRVSQETLAMALYTFQTHWRGR